MFEMRLRTINCGIYIRMVMERCSGREGPADCNIVHWILELETKLIRRFPKISQSQLRPPLGLSPG